MCRAETSKTRKKNCRFEMKDILGSTTQPLSTYSKNNVVDVMLSRPVDKTVKGFVMRRVVQKKRKKTTCRRCRNGPTCKSFMVLY